MDTLARDDLPVAAPGMAPELGLPQPVGLPTQIWRFARRKPLGFVALLTILMMGVVAAGAPAFERYDPQDSFSFVNPKYDPDNFTDIEAQNPTTLAKLAAPTGAHWLGTDNAGRDTWSRIVWGTRRSLGIGVSALLIASAVGTVLGVLSGYFSGKFDLGMQRVMDAIQAFPPLFLLILIATTREPTILTLVLALGFIGITQVSRIVRSTVLSTREMPYVEAAKVLGAGDLRLMTLHILPNVFAPIIVIFSIGLGTVIIAEASLSFLGLAPPGVSWGEMLSSGQDAIQSSPWMALFSGAAITLAVLVFNLAGDALRDILDPRLRV